MDKLKIFFTNIWPEFKDENIFLPILQKHFEVEVTDKDPQVVIHSIFGGVGDAQRFKCKKILFIGENYRAAAYPHDYSISFDPHSETNYRLPLWQYYLILRPELKDKLIGTRIKPEAFDRFCSFTVSNPANFLRNSFFQTVNSYKRVHSYGRYMTNDLSLQRMSEGRYWRDAKHEFFLKNKHKFCICFEHSSYPGYETEKLMDAFLANSVPIYWGSPTINKDWNKDAFINYMKLGANTMSTICGIDSDDSFVEGMFNQPIFTDEQKQRHIDNMNNFEEWLIDVIKK